MAILVDRWTGFGADQLTEVSAFTALPSNVHAISLAESFLRGGTRFVGLSGPSGWGKSTLTATMVDVFRERGCTVWSGPAMDALSDRQALAAKILILDDLQDCIRRPRDRHRIHLLLEHRVRRGLPVLVASTCGRSLERMPMASRWHLASIPVPTVDERVVIVKHLAAWSRITLSDDVARLIARTVRGNGRSLHGALKRLALAGGNWSGPGSLIRACGVIAVHESPTARVDARAVILDGVAAALEGWAADTVRSWSAYMLLAEAGLTEEEAARALGVVPTEVYRLSRQARRRMSLPEGQWERALCQSRVFEELTRSVGSSA